MPLDPEIAAEIAEARRILREDKVLAGQKSISDKLAKHFPDEPAEPGGGDPPNTGVPPAPEPVVKPDPSTTKPRSRWWGDSLDSSS